MKNNLIKDKLEIVPIDEKAKAEEKAVTSKDGLLEAVLGFNKWPFWFSFFGLFSFAIILLCLFLFGELTFLHHYIKEFTSKDFTGNVYINSNFLLGILTLFFSASGGTVFAIYKLLSTLSTLRIQHFLDESP